MSRSLIALREQDGVEIVVVDDGSTERDRVAAVVEQAEARLVRLDGAGPAAARNAGARAAAGEVVCFTDDDCEVRSGWVEALTAPIATGDAECTAGLTTVAADASAADHAWQAIANYLQRTAAAPGSPSPGFAPTCNLAVSRKLLTDLPFDESFPTAAGEDRDWAARAATLGAAPHYVPEARILHRPQLTPGAFLRQQYRYGRGASRYRSSDPNRGLGSPSFYLGLLRAGFAEGPTAGTLVLAAQAAATAGIGAEKLNRP